MTQRPIRFRAWDEEHKVMLTNFKEVKSKPYLNHEGVLVRYHRHHFMQFTGLKDKNGKEIYEGDVVLWTNVESKRITAQVKYSGACFVIAYPYNPAINAKNEYPIWHPEQFDFEVTGNIYEHPHLLT